MPTIFFASFHPQVLHEVFVKLREEDMTTTLALTNALARSSTPRGLVDERIVREVGHDNNPPAQVLHEVFVKLREECNLHVSVTTLASSELVDERIFPSPGAPRGLCETARGGHDDDPGLFGARGRAHRAGGGAHLPERPSLRGGPHLGSGPRPMSPVDQGLDRVRLRTTRFLSCSYVKKEQLDSHNGTRGDAHHEAPPGPKIHRGRRGLPGKGLGVRWVGMNCSPDR